MTVCWLVTETRPGRSPTWKRSLLQTAAGFVGGFELPSSTYFFESNALPRTFRLPVPYKPGPFALTSPNLPSVGVPSTVNLLLTAGELSSFHFFLQDSFWRQLVNK